MGFTVFLTFLRAGGPERFVERRGRARHLFPEVPSDIWRLRRGGCVRRNDAPSPRFEIAMPTPHRCCILRASFLLVLATAACGGDGGTGPGAGGGDGGGPGDGPGGGTAAPAAPTGLSIRGIAEGEVALKWTDASGDETSFVVERRRDGSGDFVGVGTASAGDTAFVDTSVADATRYQFRVRAANAGGVSDPSNTVAVTTPEPLHTTLEALEALLTERLPAGNTPLGQRDPGQELLAVAPDVVEIPDVVAAIVHEDAGSMQIVLSSGMSVLVDHSRMPAPEGAPQPPRAPWSPPARAVPGSRRAVAIAIDGGDEYADQVAAVLDQAGFQTERLAGTVEELRGFSGLGALYYDSHGASFNPVSSLTRDADGIVVGGVMGPARYAYQTATVTTLGTLDAYETELRNGDIVAAIEGNYDGWLQNRYRRSTLAVTESFIRRYWSLDDAIVVMATCFGGADQFTRSGTCFGACAMAQNSFYDAGPNRDALLDVGASVVMAFGNYTNAFFTTEAVTYFLDRTLGVNQIAPAVQPDRRPFSVADIQPEMEARGLMSASWPSGKVIPFRFFHRDPADWIAGKPTIASMEVVDDANRPAGTLQIQGTFSDDPGVLRVGGQTVATSTWDPFYIEAELPFDRKGRVEIEAPGGLKSNEVPLTEWRGRMTLTFEPGDGDLVAQALMDVVFRADIHRPRYEVEGEVQARAPSAYINGASGGDVLGRGRYDAPNGSFVTYSGDEPMDVLSKFLVDQGGALPFTSQFGGVVHLDGEAFTAEFCMFISGRATVTVTGADGTTSSVTTTLLILPEELVDRVDRALGCIALPMDGSYGIPSGQRVHTEGGARYTLDWTDFVATEPPTLQTRG